MYKAPLSHPALLALTPTGSHSLQNTTSGLEVVHKKDKIKCNMYILFHPCTAKVSLFCQYLIVPFQPGVMPCRMKPFVASSASHLVVKTVFFMLAHRG